MKNVMALIVMVLLVGCGTLQEQTVEYCDTTTNTFMGIPYDRDAECMGISNSQNGTGVTSPISCPVEAQ